ncbi:MAG: Rrf2 family transcriptional regulator [Bryobacteraceae bacterium]|nr:Rrf2 family transcriptional regulator [Bryobacteraceae bacterium]
MKCKYALRALYSLTDQYGQGPVLIASLSQKQQIPKKFLEVILLELKQRGMVGSRKGKGGGYQLAQSPESITIGNVIRCIDGPLAPLPCASETGYRRCEECVDENKCGTRLVMRQVREAMVAILDHTTLADVCASVALLEDREQQQESLMYYI